MSEVTAKDLREIIADHYMYSYAEREQEMKAELAAFDAIMADAEIGRRMKVLTSKNGFWLSCLDDKVLIGKRTKTWVGDDLAETLKAVPE